MSVGTTSEPDNQVPTDDQAKAMLKNRDEEMYGSDDTPPKPVGHPYGDGSYSEGARGSLDRLIKPIGVGK